MEKALIITSDRFPAGDAGATRQEALAKLLVMCGMSVDIIGMGEYTGENFLSFQDGINYISYRGKQKGYFDRARDRLSYGKRVITYLNKNECYDVILVISVPYNLIQFLKKYKKKRNIILLHDSVEWYSPNNFKYGRCSPAYIIKNLMNTKWIDSDFRVIAISSYLEEHFRNRGCICRRIPFIYDVKQKEVEKKAPSSKIRIIYAGMISRKDHLTNFLEAIQLLNPEEKERIEVQLYGFSIEDLFKVSDVSKKLMKELEGIVFINGRVSRDTVEKKLLSADFALLFRNAEERYAKAGFPTKVVESMSYCTPMFCNLSSDLRMYLRDGENCILADSENKDDILKGLKRIVALTEDERNRLREGARETALNAFDFRIYVNEMRELLGEC